MLIKTMMVVVFSTFALGCSHGGPESRNGSRLTALNDTSVPSGKPSGNFVAGNYDDALDNQITQCPHDNSPYRRTITYQADQHLAAGQEYLIETHWSVSPSGFLGVAYRLILNSVDLSKGVMVQTRRYGTEWTRSTCKFGVNSMFSFDCPITAQSLGVSRSEDTPQPQGKTCSVTDDNSGHSHATDDTGTYSFANGRSVVAARRIEHTEGAVQCTTDGGKQWVPSGSGSFDQTTIKSLEVPEPESLKCGDGTTLFAHEVTRDQAGHVLSVYQHEIHSAKF